MSETQWAVIKLGECVLSADAGTSVNSEDRPHSSDEVGVLKTSAVNAGRFHSEENKAVLEKDRRRATEPVRGGSILVSRMNTPELVGDSCFVATDHPTLFLPDRLWQVRPDPSVVDARWLAYVLQGWKTRAHINRHATGTSGSMKNLAKSNLLAMPLAVPPLATQRRIAAILAALDDQIRSTEAVWAKLNAMHQGLLLDAFAHNAPQDAGEEHPTARLGDLVSRERPIVYGILMPGENHPGGVPVVKVKDMKTGEVDRFALLRTSPSIDDEYRRSRLKPGDVLLSIRGTVGRVCVVPAELAGANITQDTARISVPEAMSRYVAHFLSSSDAQRFIASETVGLAVRGINLRDVRRIEVPLPSPRRIELVTAALDSSQQSISNEARGLSKLRDLKRGLMSDLLTGRVHIPLEAA